MSAKKYSFNKNDTPNCGDVVGVSMPTRNGRIIGLVPPKMNFGGVSNFDISCTEIKSHCIPIMQNLKKVGRG
jgi:hypothetical protein